MHGWQVHALLPHRQHWEAGTSSSQWTQMRLMALLEALFAKQLEPDEAKPGVPRLEQPTGVAVPQSLLARFAGLENAANAMPWPAMLNCKYAKAGRNHRQATASMKWLDEINCKQPQQLKEIYISDGKMEDVGLAGHDQEIARGNTGLLLLLAASSSRCEWRVLLYTQDILGPCTQDWKHHRADQRNWYRVADSPAEFSIV